MAWFDFLNQANPKGRDAGSIARQRLNARAAMPASARSILPTAGAGIPGLSTWVSSISALDPLLSASQYAQKQLQGFGIIPRPGQIKAKPTEGYSSYGTYTVGGIEYDINSGRPTYMPPGSVYPSSSVAPLSPAAERAYQSDKAAVAQQVAQDPALSQYDRDRAAAIASGDQAKMDAVRDQGMAIWQQKYGGTPMGRTGGAVGSFNPLMDRTFGYQTGMSPGQMSEMQKTAAPIQVAPGQVPYQQGDLGTRATLETGYDPAAFGLTPEKIEEMKKQLLQQASK